MNNDERPAVDNALGIEQQADDDEGDQPSPAGKFGPSSGGVIFSRALKMGLYILAFLTPLFFLPFTANVLELNKQFLLFVFSFVLLIFWLAKSLTQRKIRIQKSLVNIFIVLFLVSALVSSLLSKSIYQAMIGFGGVIAESFITLICFAIIYFLFANTIKTKKEISTLIYVLLGSALLTAILAIFQSFSWFIFPWDFTKNIAFNTVGSVNGLEIFLAAILVLAVTLFTDSKRTGRQLIVLGGISAILFFLIISLNFANVWKGLIAAMIMVVGLGIIKQGRSSQSRLIFAMVVLAMALLLTLTGLNISGGWFNAPAEVSPSFSATLDIDKGALSDKLFFGSGPSSFASNWELYRSDLINQTAFWNVRFNQGVSKTFSMPSTLGIIGVGFWLVLVVFFAAWGILKLMTKKGKNWGVAFGFFSSWIFLAIMQFLYPTNLTLEFIFWLTLGVSLALIKTLGETEETETAPKEEMVLMAFKKESPMASVLSFLLVIFLVLAISFFYLGGNFWRADIVYARGLKAGLTDNNLDAAYDQILKAANLNIYRDAYMVSLAQISLLRVDQELQKPKSAERDQRAQQFVADAVNLSKRATEINPENPDNWIQRGTVYRTILGYLPGAEDWMISSFAEATKLQPKNPYAFFELGRSYLVLSDFVGSQAGQDKEKQAKAQDYLNKAEEQFTKAAEVKNDYSPAHYQLALIYDRQGKVDQSIEKMEITRANFPNDVGVAFQLGLLYYKKQDFSKAKAEFERALTIDPNYSNARYFVGLIYDREGDKAKAKEQFQKIAELNPENAEVKKILANLEAGKSALEGIAPAPDDRAQQPVEEKQPETR